MKQKVIKQQILVAVAIFSVLVGTSAYLFYNQRQVSRVDQVRNITVIETKTASLQSNQPVLSIYGYVVVPKAIEISTGLVGSVSTVSIRPGDRVKQGQKLIQIDAIEYERALLESEAELNAVNAQIQGEKRAYKINQQALEQEKRLLLLSEKRLKRQKGLSDRGVVTEMVLENSQHEAEQHRLQVTQRTALLAQHESSIEILQARRQALVASVDGAREDVKRTSISAPSDGVIAEINVAEGSRVDKKNELIRMIPDGAYEVRAQIPSKYIDTVRGSLSKKIPLRGKVKLEGKEIDITLESLLPVVSDGQMGQQASFSFDRQEDSKIFAHKMPVYLQLKLPVVENSYRISTTALYPNDTLYVLDEEQKLRDVEIERQGYSYDENNQTMVIFTSKEPLDSEEIMITHIPNPAKGLQVQKYKD